MAKSKRKIYSTQREKFAIETAKILKAKGILSKQTKLHGGRFISQGVLKKVKEFQASANLGYKAHKVSRATAKAAKERGFQVVRGNYIVGPTERRFSNRLKQGLLTGVRPVKGGMMEVVELPHTVYDLHSLIEQLGAGIDSLKLPDEQFAFTFYGNKSHSSFLNSEHLLERFRHYYARFEQEDLSAEEMQENFRAFIIFRLHRDDVRDLIPIPTRRPRVNKKGRSYKAPTRTERLAAMHPNRAAAQRKKFAERERAKRERIAADPKKYKAYKKAARERAKRSYEARKNK